MSEGGIAEWLENICLWVLVAAELPGGIRLGRGDLSVSIGAFFGVRRIQIVYMSRYDQ